ncbi:MAG: FAD-dependent oxidoreductase [Myxococcales bacterium]|nr:FAD-dependent oxidoreductase [Myxococcales bacterium]
MSHRRRDVLRLGALLVGARLLGCGKGDRARPPAAATAATDAGADAAAPPPAAAEDAAALAPASTRADVVVIGAGMAGLAAARALADAGVATIVVEGRDRIGGRVWTDRSLGVPLDLGASWIHGVRGNPLTALADRVGARRIATDYDDHAIRDHAGRALSAGERRAIARGLAEVLAKVDADSERRDADRDLAAAIADVVADLEPSPRERALLAYAIASVIEHEYATAIADLSQFERDYGDEYGGADVIFAEGYDQLTRALAAGLDVRTGHAVTRIAHGADGVRVATDRGAVTAPRALVTLPLGVLKAGAVGFDPPLPARKQAAIAALGVGVLDKLYLRFPRVFWDDATLLGYVAPADAPGQWAEGLNLHALTGQPILLMFNAGAYAAALEAMADDAIVAAAMAALRAMYGADVPDPEATLLTRWGRDRFAGGSYSHLRPGATGADLDALAAPIDDRLYFAAKATHRHHPATVHGAYLSGLAAAEAILRAARP